MSGRDLRDRLKAVKPAFKCIFTSGYTANVICQLTSLLLASILSVTACKGDLRAEPFMPIIVVLNSYHQGETWSDNEIAGILPALQGRYPHLIPSIEHLDAKRFPTPEHLVSMQGYLKNKYRDCPVELVMVLDNPALDLMLHPGSAGLFAGVPIVFAGINGFRPEQIAGKTQITGVVETQDMAGTLKMAMGLHPGVKKVLAIHDYTARGLAVRREMDEARSQLQGEIEIVFPSEGPFEDLARELRGMPSDGVVLILTYVTDQSGRTFTREESTRLISSLSPVPVYAMHETRLGYGIVGGMLLEGKEHGGQAANLALRVLAGEAPSNIPVEKSLSRPVLDYLTLTRFRVSQDLWPPDAVVINRPVSFWQEHSAALVLAIMIVGLLILLVALLGTTLVRMRKAQWLLREKTSELDRYFGSSLDLLCIADTDGYFRRLNPEWERTLGYPLAELEGKLFLDFVHPDDLDATLAAVSQLEGQKEVLNFENRYRCKDGSYRWIEWRSFPIGKQIYAAARDITGRKRAEEALLESENKFRSFAEQALVGVYLIQDGIFKYVNPMCAEMFGYTVEECLNDMPFKNLVYGEDLIKVEEQIRKRISGEAEFVQYTFRGLKKNGEIVHVEIHGSRTVHKGKPAATGTILDISKRKRAEDALRSSEEMFSKAFQRAPLLMTFSRVDDGTYLDVNDKFVEISSFSREEAIGKTSTELGWISPEDRERLIEFLKAQGRVSGIEVTLHSKDGREVICLYNGELIMTESGQQLLSIALDVTELKKARDALADEAVRRRILIDGSRDGIVVLQHDGKVYEANKMYARMLGYTPEEVLQLYVWDWDVQWTREQLLEMIRQVDAAGDHFETRHRRKDGTFLDVEISTNGALCGGQKLIFCVCRDITERKRAEKRLQEKMDDLDHFNRLMIGRELRMIELKQEVNGLCRQLGVPQRYALEFAHDAATGSDKALE
jgi:PAS domain S-box-containing protein